MKWLNVVLIPLLLLTALPAMAEDGKAEKQPEPVTKIEEGYLYAPADCEFAMAFPSEPYAGRRCEGDDSSKCVPQMTYTKMFEGGVSVNFNVSCGAVPEGTFERYTGDAMQITMASIAAKNRLDNYETGFQQFENEAKQGVILGTGRTGDSEKLFVAQLWIGKKSILSAEGEIIGPATPEQEAFFADILASIHAVHWRQEQEKNAAESKDGKKAGKTGSKAKSEKDSKKDRPAE